MEKLAQLFFIACFASVSVHYCYAQSPEQNLPTFNIARNKKVTVNATCGEDTGGQEETYCKLVGYDSFFVKSSNRIITGQVRLNEFLIIICTRSKCLI